MCSFVGGLRSDRKRTANQKVAQTGILFRKELESINEVKEVRGKGLMLGVEFDFPVAEMRKRCFMNSMCLRDHLRTKIRYDYCHR